MNFMERLFILFLLIFGREAFASPSRSSLLILEDVAVKFEDIIERNLGDHELVVLFESHDPKVNAELTKSGNVLSIRVWGGMLNHRLMNSDTLLLLLCHEIGHYLGGPPTKSRGGWSSTEGQADYYSAYKCARDVGFEEVVFYDSALALTRIYGSVTMSSGPDLDRCDTNVVNRTIFGYPTVQCRLDTLIAGWKMLPRPQCWFSQ